MKFISPLTQEKPQEEQEIDWFDCNSYNYFPQTDAPPSSIEDSLKLQIYSDWYHKISSRDHDVPE